jgi:2,4-dienoyl-CoA reductase-like NADH-dependent reductase (Old Yellow Enzyme family)/thioredoxin reductase
MALTHLLQPITINKLEVKNRILRTGHGTYYGKGSVSDDLIAYHEARARSGVGLTTLEVTCVHRSSVNNTLFGWDDDIIPGFRKISAAMHKHGMKLFTQLWHGGHHWPSADGQPPWSASTVPSPWGFVPIAMTRDQIEEIVAAFAATAVRAREGGLDGVELHFGHGYLVHQFYSAMTNRREDAYGGSLENRMRFGNEIIDAVRRAVGPEFPVGIRLSDQHIDGGLTPEECAEIVRRLCAAKMIDFVNASMGSYHDPSSMLPTMETPVGAMLPSSGPIAAAADVPRMIAGRYRTLEEADQAIRAGVADMVGIVRAMIADADLVGKTLQGRAEQVRPCIGCNQGCIGGILTPSQRVFCTVNPVVGYERTLSEDLIVKTDSPQKVMVIGGGPAGMEAARVAALSGHRVLLFEAQPRLGGALNFARRVPKLAGIADIAYWLEREVFRLGVDVRLSTYIETADIAAEHPGAVIVATGSAPRMDGVQVNMPAFAPPGVAQSHVHSSHDIFDVPRSLLGSAALVLDDTGSYEALGVAEYLLEMGLAVTLVTRLPALAPAMDIPMRVEPALRRLRAREFVLVTRGRLHEIGERSCEIGYLEGGATWAVSADTVVLVTHNEATDTIFRELGGGSRAKREFSLKVVGDAYSPRDLLVAIREGHMAGRFIEP